jgi:Protein of unknown function (DUF1648)
MDSKFYRGLTAMLWLALPLTALQYWSVWDQLPARIATHFGVSGQPNGWMARDTSLIFAMVVTTLVLLSLTWALTRIRKPDVLAWSLLATLYVVMGALFSVNGAVLNYNLHGGPLNIVPALAVVFIAAIAVTAVALVSKRGIELPRHAEVVEAEEVHGSALWALVFTVLTAVELGVIAVIPLSGLRWVMALPALLLLAAAALAWSGFHYRFTAHGVEISTLGFRLRSIPLETIKAYAVAAWSPMGGYGIRGIGERRAYVWGNTGVRLMLSDGEVFLGHGEPGRIMQDLDLIRQSQKARENT